EPQRGARHRLGRLRRAGARRRLDGAAPIPYPAAMPEHRDAGEVTRLLIAYRQGDESAFDELVPLVYDDLRRIARQQLARLRPGATLDTTALVHEAYLKLVDRRLAELADRDHFLAIAARAMR